MITGAIDYFGLRNDGHIEASGWARHWESDIGRPVERLSLLNAPDIDIIRTDRVMENTAGCGFRFVLPSADALAALYWGGMSLQAEAKGETLVVPIWERIAEKALAIIGQHVIHRLGTGSDMIEQLRNAERANRTRDEIRGFLDIARGAPEETLLVRRGITSHDYEVALGRGGYLFLLGGSNGVYHQYATPNPGDRAEKWIELIRARKQYCDAQGIRFLQLIVPEKQSVCPEYFPAPLNVPTPIFRDITQNLAAEPYFIDCGHLLREKFLSGGPHPFRKIDSHLSYFGAETVIGEILRSLGVGDMIAAPAFHEQRMTGDLGQKFFNNAVFEDVLVPPGDWHFRREQPTLVHSAHPPGGNIGTVMQWAARSPLVHKKLLVFGNSMFERGGEPMGLSWWCARLFTQTRFVWTAGFDEPAIEDFKPDVIICQTVERFLPTLPGR